MRIALLIGALSFCFCGLPARADAGLDRAAVVRGMSAVRPALRACAPPDLGATFAVLDLTIAPDGTVAAATLHDGALGGTPVAACLARVARTATFPSFDGPAMRLAYPVPLP